MRILSTKRIVGTALGLMVFCLPMKGEQVADFRFESASNAISDIKGSASLPITGRFSTMSVPGYEPDSEAWRTDGYTSVASSRIGQLLLGSQMSATLRFAIDTYPIIAHERAEITNDNVQVELAGCLDDGSKSGFAFTIGRTGHYGAKAYVGGDLVKIDGNGIIPLWEWTELTITVNETEVKLYCNGIEVGTTESEYPNIKVGDSDLHFALGGMHDQLGGAELCGINGAFDSLVISNSVDVPAFTPDYAYLSIPASRYANDRLRARFHGMPGQNWTNETHGLYYNNGDGKYHAFFQRTGSAPIMSHQHWGHIVSDDLITWRDEKPVLAPGEDYDIKGCWSGCVFSDPLFNNGNPSIIYTGVDFSKPYAAMAFCDDPVNMRNWHKDPANPIAALTETAVGDGRDTYFYRDGENAYFLVGARDAIHYFQWGDNQWNYKGEFYHTQSGVDSGDVTEMPNITNMGDGKWLMTTSPLAGNYGTTCLYRVGSLEDGKFVNYSDAKKADLLGHTGYGLLSPSISTTSDGRIVAMGIVPDKMATDTNLQLGYAHLYSLPREWTLKDNELYQTPAKEIYDYRDHSSKFELKDFELEGTRSLESVRGRSAEIDVTFVVGDTPFGINFFKNAKGKTAKLVYNPSNGEINVDFGSISRFPDDLHFNNFSSVLPERPAKGEELKIQMFIDRSIIDIFVNDHYASSVRIFPTEDAADLIEVFAEGKTTVKHLEAYLLGEGGDTHGNPIVPAQPEKLASSGKIALYVGYNSIEEMTADDNHINVHEEKAIYDYFVSKFPMGTVLFAGDSDKINAEDFDCVWVSCDRPGIDKGWRNLPEAFSNDQFVNKLRDYSLSGGNLYLSKFAGQLVNAIGRTEDEPDVFDSGAGSVKDDEWSMQCMPYGEIQDCAIFNGLTEIRDEVYAFVLPLMSGTHHRDDHNCLWNVDNFGGAENFMARNNAEILGTWGHEGGHTGAGLIEFLPIRTRSTNPEIIDGRKGTVIVNGLAAYEWAQTEGKNESHQNILDLTTNILMYLTPVPEGSEGVELGPDPETPEIREPIEEVLETTGRVALLLGYDSLNDLIVDDTNPNVHEEKAAYDYFVKAFPDGEILFSGNTGRIKVDNFDCVWVTCDRPGLEKGWRNLPGELSNDGTVAALKQFVADGGNLYLSKFATQLVNAIERTSEEPGVFSSGNGEHKEDVWSMNIAHFGNDWTTHPLFNTLPIEDVGYGKIIPLMSGSHHRDDHNCLWNVGQDGEGFMNRNNARILGTWGHDGGHEGAGLIEFFPVRTNDRKRATDPDQVATRKGTVIANGLAAYEWAQTGGTNESHKNIEDLTSNILKYLSPVEAQDLETGIEFEPETETEVIYFNLQGIRVDNPTEGLYIRIVNGKSQKVVL